MFEWTEEEVTRLKVRAPSVDRAEIFPNDAWTTCCGFVEMMQSEGEATIAEAAQAVIEQMWEGKMPEALDVESEVLRYGAMSNHFDGNTSYRFERWDAARAAVAFWFERGGAEFVVQLLNQPSAFMLLPGKANPTFKASAGTVPYPYPYAFRMEPLWWATRMWVDRMEDADFETFRDAARAAFEELPDDSMTHAWMVRSVWLFILARDEKLVRDEIAAMKSRHASWASISYAYLAAPSELSIELIPEKIQKFDFAWDYAELYGVENAIQFLTRFVDIGTAAGKTRACGDAKLVLEHLGA